MPATIHDGHWTSWSDQRTILTPVDERLGPDSDRPVPGLVDTTASQPSAAALYDETSVIYIPSPGDSERLILALSELSGDRPPMNGRRHPLVRSLTPLIEASSTTRVCSILDRITGLRTRDGFCLLGIDQTAHDEEVLTILSRRVDGVLWVTGSGSDRFEFEYQPADRYGR